MQANASNGIRSWPELAIGLDDQLTGRGAETAEELSDFEGAESSSVGDGAEQAA